MEHPEIDRVNPSEIPEPFRVPNQCFYIDVINEGIAPGQPKEFGRMLCRFNNMRSAGHRIRRRVVIEGINDTGIDFLRKNADSIMSVPRNQMATAIVCLLNTHASEHGPARSDDCSGL